MLLFFFQRETRRVYNLLLQEEENPFEGWKIMPGYEYVTNNYCDIIMIDFVYIVVSLSKIPTIKKWSAF